jgi:hypothetical protein
MRCKMLLELGFTDMGILKVLYESTVAATRQVELVREQLSTVTECWSSSVAECRSPTVWTKCRCASTPDCGSEVSEELAPGTSCRGCRVGGKGPAGTMAMAGEWRSRVGERKTKRRVTRG